MKRLIILLAAVWLAGCAAVVKVEGEQVVRNRLSVQLPSAWNRIANHHEPFELWTQDGAALDQLRFWSGVKPGEALIRTSFTPAGQTAPRVPTFAANMPPDQLVSMFEMLFSADGSQVKTDRIEPARFAGENGVRFEFAVIRKTSELQLRGVGWAAVRNGELFAATFTAPQLSFFQRLLPKAEGVVATARLR